MHIRSVFAACTSAWLCLAATAQEALVPEQREPFSSLESSAEADTEISRESALQLQRLPPSVAALPLLRRAALPARTSPGIGNEDVVEMAEAQFSETTILAAIEANPTRFDVSPKALLSLKSDGVPERVIEAMLAAETARRQAVPHADAAVSETTLPSRITPEGSTETEAPAPAGPAAAVQMSPEALVALAEAIERLATQSAPPAPAAADAAAGASVPGDETSPVPRAWIADGDGLVVLGPTAAQVAFTDLKRSGATPFRTLQGLTEKALAFANPTLGLASGLGGLFRSDDPAMTAVWALLGPAASRALDPGTVFEIEYANIPGVNPDEYRPAIVQLVPTRDNYRLVGAAKTSESSAGGAPSGPIIEEPVAAHVTPLARGRYRVALNAHVPPGEYALVLRPISMRERERRRNSEGSLGDLMGGGSSHILYLTWDFSVRS